MRVYGVIATIAGGPENLRSGHDRGDSWLRPGSHHALDSVGPILPVTEDGARPILSDQEKRVLELLSLGLTKKQIAAAIHVSVHTVSFHLRRVYERLHVNTNTGAVAKGIRENLI
jgi:DNA-binding CsgD family transcriptional regulator